MSGPDPVERYLEAVKLLVPRSRRDAVGRELSEVLLARLNAREQELGRPLTPPEQDEVLRQHGHPMEVAGRYRSRAPIVGPLMLPIYLLTLKLGLGVAAVVTVTSALFAARAEPDPLQRMTESLLAFPGRALNVIVWTTVVFAALEIAQRRLRLFPGWDALSLRTAPAVKPGPSRGRAFVGVLFAFVGIAWFLQLPRMPQLLLGPAAAYIEPGGVWRAAYVPILVLFVFSALLEAADFGRPTWTPWRSYGRIALNAASLVVALMLINGGALFVPRASSAGQGEAADLASAIGAGMRIGLTIWAVVAVIEMFRQMVRLKHHRLALAVDRDQR